MPPKLVTAARRPPAPRAVLLVCGASLFACSPAARPLVCGDGVVDPGELCDGSCPSSCDDAQACTADTLVGSAARCDATCEHAQITACASGDGCCAPGCDVASDGDCPPPRSAALLACADVAVAAPQSATRPVLADSDGDGSRDYLETISAPLPDQKPMYVPLAEYPGQTLLKCGLLDVTQPPFGADRTGLADATTALREAVRVANLYHLVAYFPLGRYAIGDTVECVQSLYRRTGRPLDKLHGAQGGCYFLGERGAQGEHPVLVLPPGTAGYTDAAAPRAMLSIWARGAAVAERAVPQSNISMRNYVVGLDFEVGSGNVGAVALSHPAAQGSFIEDVRIALGDGDTGLYGVPGSGGGVANVSITGGRVGIRTGLRIFGFSSNTAAGVALTGLELKGQRQYAILHAALETATVTGAEISMAAGASGPAVAVVDPAPYVAPRQANLALVDSTIEFATFDAGNVGVGSRNAVYVKGSAFRNVGSVLSAVSGAGTRSILAGPAAQGQWRSVGELAFGPSFTVASSDGGVDAFSQPSYVNGVRQTAEAWVVLAGDSAAAPASPRAGHLWGSDFVSLNDPTLVNVRAAPYRAEGDGHTDDTAALQAALDEHERVFLPKGYYRISRPLMLRPMSKVLGLGAVSSLVADHTAPAFADAGSPQPMLQTAAAAAGATQLAMFELLVNARSAGSYALRWQVGGDSVLRNVVIRRHSDLGFSVAAPEVPFGGALVRASGAAAGRWYDLFFENNSAFLPGYRQLLVADAAGPLSIYMLDNEGGHGEAMTEILRSSDVTVYQSKSEGEYPIIWVRDSQRVGVYGRSGNHTSIGAGASYPAGYEQVTPSSFKIDRSTQVTFASLIDRLGAGCDQVVPPVPDCGAAQSEWVMLIERPAGGGEIDTRPLEKPILYKRD